MKITEQLVDELAQLCRLSLLEEERRAMTAQLERIVDYMDVLRRLDTKGVELDRQAYPVRNVFREDVVAPSLDRRELLANAPEPDEQAFLTPKSVE